MAARQLVTRWLARIYQLAWDAASTGCYFLAWIDRLEKDLNRRDRMHTGKDHVAMQLKTATEVYQRLAGKR